ncbi:hypothetical protein HK100_009734 [Physocladia obscura]|uniref:TmcB/TmcC TPR repeats domain-containing protein n=1 Tax=Physocladia obscura TaxID=109957 RepID=A0AAD5TBL5_9FUNG|nr:hypothetical protein HK100_009734 [Physocladia obscura]
MTVINNRLSANGSARKRPTTGSKSVSDNMIADSANSGVEQKWSVNAKPPDLKTLQKELERDPKHESRITKLIKRATKFYVALKKGFFASLVALLVESHNSVVTLMIIFIEFLQNLAFCFADIDWGPYGNKYGYILIFTQVEEAVVKYTFPEAILVLVAIAVVLNATMIILAFYVIQSFMKSDFNKGVWPLRLLRTLVSMLASIFFLPMVYSLFTIFVCHNGLENCDTNPIFIAMRVLSAITLPTFIAFTLLMSMTYFNPNPKATSISARPTARLEILELSNKILLAWFFVFETENPVLREAITLLCSFSTAVFMWIYIPYYKKEINLYRFSLICQVIWGSLLALVVSTVCSTDDKRNGVFFTYCSGIIPVTLAAYFSFNMRQNYATSYELACKNFKVDNLDAFNTWEVEDAVKDGANEKRFWTPSQVEIATRFLITSNDKKSLEIADKIYLFGTKKFPQSSALMVQYAIFFLVFKEDSSVAASYLKKAEKAKQMLIDTEFTIYQQQQEIKSGGATVGNKKLDAVDRVEFKQLTKEAKLYYKDAKANIASFWLAIMSAKEGEAADTAVLMTHVSQMERSDSNATEAYKRLIQRYPLSIRVLRNYAEFLEKIHNNHEESEIIHRRIKRICDAGLSDDPMYIATGGSGVGMSKKSKKAFKAYRKQVYHYSKGNSAHLTWMIRGTFLMGERTQINLTLMDATSIYLQRINLVLNSLQSNGTAVWSSLDAENTDWRFVLDNGLTSLVDAYTTVEHYIVTGARDDISVMQYIQIGIFAKSERETSLKAFLQIPHEVTEALYAKYYDPDSNSRESLNGDSDDDHENEKSTGLTEAMRSQTGYKSMTVISAKGLLLIGFFFIGSFGTDLWLLLSIMSIPAGISDASDIPKRSERITVVTTDLANWGTSTFSYNTSVFSQTSMKNLILNDINEIIQSQLSLLYGSSYWPHYEQKFDLSLISDIFPSPLSETGIYEVVAEFIEDSTVLANTNPIISTNLHLISVVKEQNSLQNGYLNFLQNFLNWANLKISLLQSMAFTVWAIMIVIIIATYFLYWRRILNYLIKTENERTLKLLLMIPVEIVADIDSLRELLHLKRNTITAAPTNQMQPPPIIGISTYQTTEYPAPLNTQSLRQSTSTRPQIFDRVEGSEDEYIKYSVSEKNGRRQSLHPEISNMPFILPRRDSAKSTQENNLNDAPPVPAFPSSMTIRSRNTVTPRPTSQRLSQNVQAFLAREANSATTDQNQNIGSSSMRASTTSRATNLINLKDMDIKEMLSGEESESESVRVQSKTSSKFKLPGIPPASTDIPLTGAEICRATTISIDKRGDVPNMSLPSISDKLNKDSSTSSISNKKTAENTSTISIPVKMKRNE